MLIKTWIYIEQKYNELWYRVKDPTGKDFEVRALHENECITTKTKSYKDEISTMKLYHQIKLNVWHIQ